VNNLNLKHYPYPVARSYQQFRDTKPSGPATQFRAALRTFTSVLKYCAITSVSGYRAIIEGGGDHNPELTHFIYNNLLRPSLGHWNHFLRETLLDRRTRCIRQPAGDTGCNSGGTSRETGAIGSAANNQDARSGRTRGYFAELDAFYFKNPNKTKPARGAVLINELIATRNEWFHPGLDLEGAKAEHLLAATTNQLDELLTLLAFLQDYPLIYHSGGTIRVLKGSSLGAAESLPWSGPPLEERELYLRHAMNDDDGAWSACDLNDLTPLCFLLEGLSPDGTAESEYMFLETARLTQKKRIKMIKYILGNTWGYDEDVFPEHGNRAYDTFRIAASTTAAAPPTQLTWPHVAAIARQLLRDTRKGMETGGKVIPALYISRSTIDGPGGTFETFLGHKTARCLLLLGNSGHGKTNLMWRLATHAALQPHEDTAVFFFEGRNLHPTGIDKAVDEALCMPGGLRALIESLAKGDGEFDGKRVVIFIDALNEYHNPTRLLREALNLFDKDRRPASLRVVATCRTVSWPRMKAMLSAREESLLYRGRTDQEDEYPDLAMFSQEELEAAYARYAAHFGIATTLEELSPRTRRLLSDPLMLRLASEAYAASSAAAPVAGARTGSTGAAGTPSTSSIPRELDIARVFEAYDATRNIDPRRDEPFLENVISHMWDNLDCRLTGPVVRRHEELHTFIDEPPLDIVPGSTYQCTACKAVLRENDSGFAPGGACPLCGSLDIATLQADWRTTYERLQEEGILTEDLVGDDIAVRFVYDRYFEYRVARWILAHGQPGAGADGTEAGTTDLDVNRVAHLTRHAAGAATPILTEAVKQAVLMAAGAEAIILGLAAAGDGEQFHRDLAASCIVELAERGETDRAAGIVERLVASGPAARLVAIDAAAEGGPATNLALLAPLPRKDGAEEIAAAISSALYRVWRNDRDRALTLMQGIAEHVRPLKLIFGGTAPLMVLLDVTLRTLGVFHHDDEVSLALGDLWKKVLASHLHLGRRNILAALLRWNLTHVATLFGVKRLRAHGMSFEEDSGGFTPGEQQALLDILDAWGGSREALQKLPDIITTYGPDALDEQQRDRLAGKIAVLFSCGACVVGMNGDPTLTTELFGELFARAGALSHHGRHTRFFVCSALNFALQLNYPKMRGPETNPEEYPLERPYRKLLDHFRILIETDPEIFVPVEMIPGTPNSLFGILSQAVVRMDGDICELIVEPMLQQAAAKGHPGLLKAYLRNGVFFLDTFSQRISAHTQFLRSLELLSDIPAVAARVGVDPQTLTSWLVEAYALAAVGYRADVELFIAQNTRLPEGFLGRVQQAHAQPSLLLESGAGEPLSRQVAGILAGWSIADGGNSLIANFPEIREKIVGYLKRIFKTGELKPTLKSIMKDLLEFLIRR